jgi:hypothetical protein
MNRAYRVIVRAYLWLASHTEASIIGLAVVLMAAAPRVAFGQSAVWQPQGATTGNIYYNGGNVGIGTAAPDAIAGYNSLTLNGANSGLLTVLANGTFIFRLYGDASNGPAIDSIGLPMRFIANGERMRISPAGNVGIGTTNPQHRLHVAGTIGAEEVLVTSTGADYVFRPGYRLQPLSEVAAYIQANHHLPDIPSEAEVKLQGMGVGAMEAKLLAKVEELTLHMIQAEKQNQEQNQELRERLARLENGAATSATAAAAK